MTLKQRLNQFDFHLRIFEAATLHGNNKLANEVAELLDNKFNDLLVQYSN